MSETNFVALLPLISNWTPKHYGSFVGTFDVRFRPGPLVPGFHVFISKGRVLIGPPQDEHEDNLFEFDTYESFEEFRRYALSMLLDHEDFVVALRSHSILDVRRACGLPIGGSDGQ